MDWKNADYVVEHLVTTSKVLKWDGYEHLKSCMFLPHFSNAELDEIIDRAYRESEYNLYITDHDDDVIPPPIGREELVDDGYGKTVVIWSSE